LSQHVGAPPSFNKETHDRMAMRIENTGWKIEWRGANGSWWRIGRYGDEAEARQTFQRAVREYPADTLIRLVRPDGTSAHMVRGHPPATGKGAD
jgi:hypothetical protein